MDRLTKEQREKNMKAVKNKGSEIETLLMKALWNRGYRYTKNDKAIFGKPDIAFKKYKIVVFCDSEFWHGKDWEIKKHEIKSNKEFWYNKIKSNIERDKLVNKTLKQQGWVVLRFWGKEIKKKSDICVNVIISEIEKAKKMSFIRKLSTGKSQIIKNKVFCEILRNKLPQKDNLHTDTLDYLGNAVLKKDKTISKGALNNVFKINSIKQAA